MLQKNCRIVLFINTKRKIPTQNASKPNSAISKEINVLYYDQARFISGMQLSFTLKKQQKLPHYQNKGGKITEYRSRCKKRYLIKFKVHAL